MDLKVFKYYFLHFTDGETKVGNDISSYSKSISGRAEAKSHCVPYEKNPEVHNQHTGILLKFQKKYFLPPIYFSL